MFRHTRSATTRNRFHSSLSRQSAENLASAQVVNDGDDDYVDDAYDDNYSDTNTTAATTNTPRGPIIITTTTTTTTTTVTITTTRYTVRTLISGGVFRVSFTKLVFFSTLLGFNNSVAFNYWGVGFELVSLPLTWAQLYKFAAQYYDDLDADNDCDEDDDNDNDGCDNGDDDKNSRPPPLRIGRVQENYEFCAQYYV